MEEFGFIKNDNYNDPNNRYPLGSRDKDYVRQMNLLNDSYWKNTEKWHYYNINNQNSIIPTAIGCIVIFFGAHPAISIPMVIFTILLILFLCHLNNLKLDDDPYVQMWRKRSREYRRNHLHMDV